MKTAVKTFIIIGCVLGCFMIYPLVLGIVAYDKLEHATHKKELTGWAILALLFVSRIGGIMMLFITDQELSGVRNDKNTNSISAGTVQAGVHSGSDIQSEQRTIAPSINKPQKETVVEKPSIASSAIVQNDQLQSNTKQTPPYKTQTIIQEQENEAFEGLVRIKQLLDEKAITEEVYLQKKAEYLAKL